MGAAALPGAEDLAAGLERTAPERSAEAAETLAYGGETGIAALTLVLRSRRASDEVLLSAMDALGGVYIEEQTAIAAPELASYVRPPRDADEVLERVGWRQVFCHHGPVEVSDDPSDRALDALGSIGEPALSPLLDALEKGDARTRRGAAWALVGMWQPEDVQLQRRIFSAFLRIGQNPHLERRSCYRDVCDRCLGHGSELTEND